MSGHLVRIGLLALVAMAFFVGRLAAFDAGGENAPAGNVEAIFERGDLSFEIDGPTSLAFGPDGRLYASTQNDIIAITLDDITHDAVAIEEIATDLHGVIGLAFDHTAPPEAPIKLYASHQDFEGVPGYWGRISTFTAPDWTQQTIIKNLPSSAPLLNHLTNGLAFGDDGRLFIAQGSNTDAGLPGEGPDPDYYPESALSAAILVADVNDPSFNGTLIYNPPGQPLDHNVDLVSGDVAVFAPGLRNSYDLVFHSNGHLYAADNGALGRDGAASCDGATVDTSVSDELNLIEEGNYYGFPNLNRGRSDPRQCTYRDPRDGSGPDFVGPIVVMARHCSCDGIVEYQGPALGGAMNGDLIIARFTRGDLRRVELTEDGRGVTKLSTIAEDFDMPLDVTVAPDGTLYVADFDDNLIAFLVPIAATATPTLSQTDTSTPTDTPTQTPTPTGPPGDANCDESTNSIDAALVLQTVAGLIDGVGCPDLADVNGDGMIDAIDAALILQIDAGLL
ncbi:MAG: PQQ-dependent sugar dehydrogenase [Chloroflexi bacterium]|nr:PQQ-dependent sugar dehydrogenase [Chloroflexota bacterium]